MDLVRFSAVYQRYIQYLISLNLNTFYNFIHHIKKPITDFIELTSALYIQYFTINLFHFNFLHYLVVVFVVFIVIFVPYVCVIYLLRDSQKNKQQQQQNIGNKCTVKKEQMMLLKNPLNCDI